MTYPEEQEILIFLINAIDKNDRYKHEENRLYATMLLENVYDSSLCDSSCNGYGTWP